MKLQQEHINTLNKLSEEIGKSLQDIQEASLQAFSDGISDDLLSGSNVLANKQYRLLLNKERSDPSHFEQLAGNDTANNLASRQRLYIIYKVNAELKEIEQAFFSNNQLISKKTLAANIAQLKAKLIEHIIPTAQNEAFNNNQLNTNEINFIQAHIGLCALFLEKKRLTTQAILIGAEADPELTLSTTVNTEARLTAVRDFNESTALKSTELEQYLKTKPRIRTLLDDINALNKNINARFNVFNENDESNSDLQQTISALIRTIEHVPNKKSVLSLDELDAFDHNITQLEKAIETFGVNENIRKAENKRTDAIKEHQQFSQNVDTLTKESKKLHEPTVSREETLITQLSELTLCFSKLNAAIEQEQASLEANIKELKEKLASSRKSHDAFVIAYKIATNALERTEKNHTHYTQFQTACANQGSAYGARFFLLTPSKSRTALSTRIASIYSETFKTIEATRISLTLTDNTLESLLDPVYENRASGLEKKINSQSLELQNTLQEKTNQYQSKKNTLAAAKKLTQELSEVDEALQLLKSSLDKFSRLKQQNLVMELRAHKQNAEKAVVAAREHQQSLNKKHKALQQIKTDLEHLLYNRLCAGLSSKHKELISPIFSTETKKSNAHTPFAEQFQSIKEQLSEEHYALFKEIYHFKITTALLSSKNRGGLTSLTARIEAFYEKNIQATASKPTDEAKPTHLAMSEIDPSKVNTSTQVMNATPVEPPLTRYKAGIIGALAAIPLIAGGITLIALTGGLALPLVLTIAALIIISPIVTSTLGYFFGKRLEKKSETLLKKNAIIPTHSTIAEAIVQRLPNTATTKVAETSPSSESAKESLDDTSATLDESIEFTTGSLDPDTSDCGTMSHSGNIQTKVTPTQEAIAAPQAPVIPIQETTVTAQPIPVPAPTQDNAESSSICSTSDLHRNMEHFPTRSTSCELSLSNTLENSAYNNNARVPLDSSTSNSDAITKLETTDKTKTIIEKPVESNNVHLTSSEEIMSEEKAMAPLTPRHLSPVHSDALATEEKLSQNHAAFFKSMEETLSKSSRSPSISAKPTNTETLKKRDLPMGSTKLAKFYGFNLLTGGSLGVTNRGPLIRLVPAPRPTLTATTTPAMKKPT